MSWVTPVTLSGECATLSPLSQDHANDLIEAVRDGELWKLWYTTVPQPQDMSKEIDRRFKEQAEKLSLPFVAIDNATGKAIGMTSYLNIDQDNRRLEIGSTWYRRSSQRTSFNTEAKWLLLTHAFETLNCNAVEFRTHFCNQQSRRGIERLGAKLDGILRNHRLMPNGTLRDTCVYSIIANEWLTIKEHLRWLMSAPQKPNQ